MCLLNMCSLFFIYFDHINQMKQVFFLFCNKHDIWPKASDNISRDHIKTIQQLYSFCFNNQHLKDRKVMLWHPLKDRLFSSFSDSDLVLMRLPIIIIFIILKWFINVSDRNGINWFEWVEAVRNIWPRTNDDDVIGDERWVN